MKYPKLFTPLKVGTLIWKVTVCLPSSMPEGR